MKHITSFTALVFALGVVVSASAAHAEPSLGRKDLLQPQPAFTGPATGGERALLQRNNGNQWANTNQWPSQGGDGDITRADFEQQASSTAEAQAQGRGNQGGWQQWLQGQQANNGQGNGNRGQGANRGQGQTEAQAQSAAQAQSNNGRGNGNRGQAQSEAQAQAEAQAQGNNVRGNGQSQAQVQGTNGGNRGNPWLNNRQALNPYIGDFNTYQDIRPQAVQATGQASALAQGVRRRGNARAAAQSLAQATSSGEADAAAQAVASAAASTSSSGATATAEATAVSETIAETAAYNPRAASNLFAKSAGYAVSRGQTRSYARAVAGAFAVARQRRYLPQFTSAVAEAIATGGSQSRYAYGQAIATAIAQGGDSSAAVADATATAICTGGSTANAWASAYAVALSQDSRGCLVLNQARAIAQARCGRNGAEASAQSEASSRVLGFCGLLNYLPGGFNFGVSGANSGSNSYGSLYGK
eukprot:GHRR01009243.1.p1 GENE.GHRR01009243.1~~GHRR01009243.1.p1  ORF type:complete len:473 (+),score=194.98 GHRR01009243.1:401-1819(+)